MASSATRQWGRVKGIWKREGALVRHAAWTFLQYIHRGWELENELLSTHPPQKSHRHGIRCGMAGDARPWCWAGSQQCWGRCCEGMAGRRDLKSKPIWGRHREGKKGERGLFCKGWDIKGCQRCHGNGRIMIQMEIKIRGGGAKEWSKGGGEEKQLLFPIGERLCALEGLP